jgi:glycine/D-amino acid oxidase-like deaminating enzyme
MNRPADVIIVGGGIIGTTAALALSDLGLQVVLIGNLSVGSVHRVRKGQDYS